MWKTWMVLAAVHGFISVACGAFGAHGLRDRLSEKMLANWETGARYEMYHALALFAVAWLAARQPSGAASAAGWCFALGAVVFSFSLYAMALLNMPKLGAVTPIGGGGLLAGWALLAYAAATASRTAAP